MNIRKSTLEMISERMPGQEVSVGGNTYKVGRPQDINGLPAEFQARASTSLALHWRYSQELLSQPDLLVVIDSQNGVSRLQGNDQGLGFIRESDETEPLNKSTFLRKVIIAARPHLATLDI